MPWLKRRQHPDRYSVPRGLATHYEMTATVYRASVLIEGIFLWFTH
ncbi:hypothetical protein ACN6K9_000427 [Streptomyces sp. SAS_267]